MLHRCQNPANHAFADYGGRGISVCDRWTKSFEAFLEDMGPKPTPQHSIDRVDNDGPYSPENCHWATKREQVRNMRRNAVIVVDGVRRKVIELAEEQGLKYSTIIQRFQRGNSAEQILSKEKLPNWTDEARMAGPAANSKKWSARTHCPIGHEMTPDNTIVDNHGGRRCKICRYNNMRKRRSKTHRLPVF